MPRQSPVCCKQAHSKRAGTSNWVLEKIPALSCCSRGQAAWPGAAFRAACNQPALLGWSWRSCGGCSSHGLLPEPRAGLEKKLQRAEQFP